MVMVFQGVVKRRERCEDVSEAEEHGSASEMIAS
jgi:hypothetical protein